MRMHREEIVFPLSLLNLCVNLRKIFEKNTNFALEIIKYGRITTNKETN
mgnify:CR=1 FL=1